MIGEATAEDVLALVYCMPHWHGDIYGPHLGFGVRVALHLDLVIRHDSSEVEELLYTTAMNWCADTDTPFDAEEWEVGTIYGCNMN